MDIYEELTRLTGPQNRFLELLAELVRQGRTEWVESNLEPGFVSCLIDGEELIEFELFDGERGDRGASAASTLGGVTVHYCNTTQLWLPVTPGWEELILLLRQTRMDHDRFVQFRRESALAPARALGRRLTGAP